MTGFTAGDLRLQMWVYCLKPDGLCLFSGSRDGGTQGLVHPQAVTRGRGPKQGCPPRAHPQEEGRQQERTACVSFSCCTSRTSPRRGSWADSSSSFCPSQSMISWRGTCSFPLWSEKASSRALAGEQGQSDRQTDRQERSRVPEEGKHSTMAGC